MATAKGQALSPRVKRLAKDFTLQGADFRLPVEKLRAWELELAGLPAKERAGCAEQLVALAVRFQREGGPQTQIGVGQLCYFAAGLLGAAPAASRKGQKGRAASGGR